jgi:hypothetical protein
MSEQQHIELATTALVAAAQADTTMAGARQKGVAYVAEALRHLIPVFDSMGMAELRGLETPIGRLANKIEPYVDLKNSVCSALSRALGDDVTIPNRKGSKPVFTPRVSKVWSRIVTRYATGDDGESGNGQTKSDKAGHARAAAKRKLRDEQAALLVEIVAHHESGKPKALKILLDEAVQRFGTNGTDAAGTE